MKGSFSIDEVFSYGWKTMLKNFWFFVVLIIIIGAVGGLLGGSNSALANNTEDWAIALTMITSIIYLIAMVILQIGVLKVSLNLLDGKKATYGELFKNWDIFANYLLASILYGLVVFAGLLLLVFPGIIWGIRYRMYSYLIVDKKMGAWEALVESSRITKGQRWQLFAFEFPKAVAAIIGFIALGVGFFFAYPTILMAEVAVYRDLLDRAKK